MKNEDFAMKPWDLTISNMDSSSKCTVMKPIELLSIGCIREWSEKLWILDIMPISYTSPFQDGEESSPRLILEIFDQFLGIYPTFFPRSSAR